MIKKIAQYSNILLIITNIHHVYGAYIYSTPWRMHVLIFSIPILIYNTLLLKEIVTGKIWDYLFWVLTVIFSIGQVGLFEGIYNHLIKIILFFSGSDKDLINRLFPAPAYEMPNDFFFELTGVAQAFMVIPLIYLCIKALKNKQIVLNKHSI